MEFDSNIPIYQQIVYEFKRRIVSGDLKKGDKIPSVRDLAVEMGVNPNTMQKALSTLEQEGLLVTERTSGRYVTQDEGTLSAMKENMVKGEVTKFILLMKAFGYTLDEITELIKDNIHNSGGASNGRYT